MMKLWSAILVVMALGVSVDADAQNIWNKEDYDLYSGDFDGDGFSDLLYVARKSGDLSGIALFDGAGFNLPLQSWGNAYLGIPWSSGEYRILVADFNGDKKDDLFLQRNTPGDHYLLLTEDGGIGGIYQAVPQDAAGIAWSADVHQALAGDFDGDGRADLFFQPTDGKGLSAVVLTDGNGQFTSKEPDQSWENGYAGFNWATTESLIFSGDFDANGQDDLLIQAQPLPGTGPDTGKPAEFASNMNGVALAQDGKQFFATEGVQAWSQDGFGADWSPVNSNAIVGDFNGDGHSDALLQGQTDVDPSYLLYGKSPGAVFQKALVLDTDTMPSAEEFKVVVGHSPASKADALYFQSTKSSQGNFLGAIDGTQITVANEDASPAVPAANEPLPAGGGGGVAAALTVTSAGRTPGQFSVSAFGGAAYQIPLWTPPGARGIDPHLSLVYMSGGPDGPLGPGWMLAGLSAITRCGKTFASSVGSPAPIKLTTSDDICLDGNRLRLTGGSQLAAGSTYQTEIEIFSRVTAFSSAGNGPSYFIVEGKDGLKYEYGNTADSKAYAVAGSTPYAWLLNKVLDRQGNNLKITYSTTNGDTQPISIQYTQTPAKSTTYPYTLNFTYQARVTNLSKYVAGGNILQTKVLSKIDVKSSGTSVRQYNLTYASAPTTIRDRLASVQECAGSAGTDCLRPTSITYQNGSAGVPNPTTSTGSGATSGYANTIDVNGDGRMDLVYATLSGSTYTWWVKFATSSGFGSATSTGATSLTGNPVMFDDFDGNGSADVLMLSGTIWYVLRWNGTAFTFTSTGQAIGINRPPGANWDYQSADTNGDGLPDLVSARTGGQLYIRLNTSALGTVTFASTETLAGTLGLPFTGMWGNNSRPSSAIRRMDFDGDGRDDIVTTYTSPGGQFVLPLTSQGTTFAGAAVGSTNEYTQNFFPVNWNDDSCTDLMLVATVFIAGCNGAPQGQIPGLASGTVAIDWDGDGRTDLLSNSGGTLRLYRSLGTSVATSVPTGIPTGTGNWKVFDQNGDGLGDLAFVDSSASFAIKYGLHNGANVPADLATTIADGWGISGAPTYVPITQSNYTKGTGAQFPDMDIQLPIYVVSQAVQSDGIGGTYTNTYSYYRARINRQGRGFLGFDETRAQDLRNNLYQDTYYQQDFPFIGRVRQQDLLQSDGTSLISRTVNEFDKKVFVGTDCVSATSRCFPFVKKQTVTTNDITSSAAPAVQSAVMDYVFDIWGNPTSITTTTTDKDALSPSAFLNSVWTSVISNTYTNDTTNWCLGLPTHTTTQNTVPGPLPGPATATRTVDHAVNAANCRFTSETIEPSTNPQKIVTTFSYATSECGNVSSVSVVGRDQNGTALPARVTSSTYGTRCQFAETVTDPLSKTTNIVYNYNYGVKSSTTDPNGVGVSWLYDNFGRRTRENRPDSTYTTWDYNDCISATCWGEVDLRMLVSETQYSSTAALVRSRERYFDGLERTRFDAGHRVLGVWTNTKVTYDSLGRKQDIYQPYSTGTNGYHHFDYDDLNRPTTDTWYAPNGTVDRTTSLAYVGLKTTYTDAKGKDTQKWTDVAGKLRRIVDPSPGATTKYDYDPFGNLVQMTDATTNVTTYGYNIRGFKTSANDPDTGSSTFVANSLNELISQTDANGQLTTFTYDALGRMLTRLEPESATATQWTYGTSAAAHEIGQLKTVTKPDGYAESYTYDSIGRPASVTYTEDTTYQVNYSYNTIGALDIVTYPTSTSGFRLRLKHDYSYGFLQQVTNDNSGVVYWTLNSANEYSSPLTELLGNAVTITSDYKALTNEIKTRQVGSGGSANNLQDLSYTWDDNGNMNKRQDLAQGLSETFTYNTLNQLKTVKLGANQTLSVTYDAAGNITNKSDVSGSDYDYTTNQSGCSYTGHTAQPHAVRNAAGVVYCYDKNGNMTKRGGSTITWYSYNQPNNIASGSNSTQFNYNANHQRWKQVAVDAGVTTTTYYVGGILEKVVRPGVTEYRHLIPAGSNSVIYKRNTDSTTNIYYVTSDHLGSGDLVMNSSGGVMARESFTAFGERRGSNWQGPPSAGDMTVFGNTTRRGFTGHEMLDAVGLVNMNGRVYDPRIGRFLSADPIIKTISLSQALNPYSYVMNNPLTLIDPSGYSWLSSVFKSVGHFLKKWGGLIIATAFAAMGMPWWFAALYGTAFASLVNDRFTPVISFSYGFGGASTSFGPSTAGAAGGAAGPLIVTTTTIPTVMTWQSLVVAGDRMLSSISDWAQVYLQLKPWYAQSTTSTPGAEGSQPSMIGSINAYLRSKHSPLAGLGSDFYYAGLTYNVDPRLLVALAGAETGFGKTLNESIAGKNNVFNWNMPRDFDSYSDAVWRVARQLEPSGKYATSRGSIEDMYMKGSPYHYCSGDDCINGLTNINRFLKEQFVNNGAVSFPWLDYRATELSTAP